MIYSSPPFVLSTVEGLREGDFSNLLSLRISSISPDSLKLRLISSSIFARRVLADQEAPRFFCQDART